MSPRPQFKDFGKPRETLVVEKPRTRYNSTALYLGAALSALAISTAFTTVYTLDNSSDLCFGAGLCLPFNLLQYYNPTPDTILTKPCSELSEAFTSYIPTLFKGCTKEYTLMDFLPHADETQNLFPRCKVNPIRRNKYIDEEELTINEVTPCEMTTLQEKMDSFNNGTCDRPLVHTRMSTYDESAEFIGNLTDMGVLPHDFPVPHPCVVAHYFFPGDVAVYYPHAHMDRFLSFNFGVGKKWFIINPRYINDFMTNKWSGNALIPLEIKDRTVPTLSIVQEKGDIMFLPSWWVHWTDLEIQTSSASFNMHFMVPSRQLSGFFAGTLVDMGIKDLYKYLQ